MRKAFACKGAICAFLLVIQMPFAQDFALSDEISTSEADGECRVLFSSVSPDRTRMVFGVYRAQPRNTFIYWTPIYRPQPELVATEVSTDCPSWSPDSRKFVYSAAEIPPTNAPEPIRIFDTMTGRLETVLSEGGDFLPAFSPMNDDFVAFYREEGHAEYYLYLLQVSTKSVKQITPDGLAKPAPWCWSTDGNEIYYCAQKGEHSSVRSVNIDSLSTRDVLEFSGEPEDLQPLPDGQTFCVNTFSRDITFFKKDGRVTDVVRPSNAFYGGMNWLDSRIVTFLLLSNESKEWSLTVSDDSLASFNVLTRGLSINGILDEKGRLAWVSPKIILYSDQKEIALIRKDGEKIGRVFSIESDALPRQTAR